MTPTPIRDAEARACLWQLPALSVEEFFGGVLGLAESTWEALLRERPAGVFLLGRRRYITRESAAAWLDEAAGVEYAPRRNRRST